MGMTPAPFSLPVPSPAARGSALRPGPPGGWGGSGSGDGSSERWPLRVVTLQNSFCRCPRGPGKARVCPGDQAGGVLGFPWAPRW